MAKLNLANLKTHTEGHRKSLPTSSLGPGREPGKTTAALLLRGALLAFPHPWGHCPHLAPAHAVQMTVQHAVTVSPPLERVYFHQLQSSPGHSADSSSSLPQSFKEAGEL